MQLTRSKKSGIYIILIELVLAFIIIMLNMPFFWMLATSIREREEIYLFPPRLIPSKLNFEGYQYIWTLVPFARYLYNSFFIAFTISVAKILLASLAAYAFAKVPFKGRRTVFYAFLGTMMIPFEVIVIPNYITVKILGWLDTYYALIVPFTVGAFSIFLLRQFFLTIPQDLDDAAEIDGAGRLRYLFTIIFPLSKPALLTVGLYSFLAAWNSFLWPLIVTNRDEMRVVQIALKAMQENWMIEWNALTAASTLATVPIIILFFFVQKQFLEGITITGLKT